MKKELEAVKFIYETAIDEWNVGTGTRERLDEYCGMLVEALTPPTADEVCEALSEWYMSYDVRYDESEYAFYFITDGRRSNITDIDSLGMLSINTFLQPNLITLIGRFYEGIGKK